MQERVVIVGDLALGSTDDYGTRIYLNDLSGWDGWVGTTSEAEQLPAAHGAWLNPAYLPARIIEATVTMVGLTFPQVSLSLSLLAGRVPLDQTVDMTVDDHGIVLSAKVRLGADLKWRQVGHIAQASIVLIAPDPRKYSITETVESTGLPSSSGGLTLPATAPFTIDAVTTSGVLTVTNDGNISTPPILRVSGPCPPFTLRHNSGRQLYYPQSIAAGRYVEFDAATRTALEDGTAARYVAGSWFEYEPGLNTVAFESSSYDADARLTSTHRSAWK